MRLSIILSGGASVTLSGAASVTLTDAARVTLSDAITVTLSDAIIVTLSGRAKGQGVSSDSGDATHYRYASLRLHYNPRGLVVHNAEMSES